MKNYGIIKTRKNTGNPFKQTSLKGDKKSMPVRGGGTERSYMKRKLRLIAAVLSAAMVPAIFAGCGEKNETAKGGGIKTVTVWTCNSHSKAVVTRLCNDWNETKGKEKGIKIDYQIKSADNIIQSTELALKSGNAPDFFGSGDLVKYATNGDIMPIDDLPGGSEIINSFRDYIEEGRTMYQGKTYTLPTTATSGGLVYNKDMFKAAGIVDENGEAKPPETLEEMRKCAKKLTDVANKQYGIIYPMKWDGWFAHDIICTKMSSDGFETYNPGSGKFEYDGFKPVFEAFLGMRDDGSVYPGAESLDNDTARALFAEGGIGMKLAMSFDVGVYNDQFPAKIDWGVAPYPVADKNNKYKQRMDVGGGWFINAHSKLDKSILAEIVKFISSDDFIRTSYKEGTDLPCDWSKVDDIELKDAKKGWEDFAKLVGESALIPLKPKTDKSGLRSDDKIFIEDIYTGKISIDDGIALMNENANAAVENYYSAHKDEDKNQYYKEGWQAPKR